MQTASGNFSAATLAGDQMVDKRVIISFPAGVQASFQDVSQNVVSITPRRAVTSALNEQTTLIAGVSTASLDIVLAGMLNQGTGAPTIEGQTIDWLMRPNDPTSPMFRKTCGGLTVTVQMGYWLGGTTPEWVTIYTGTIDTPAVSDGYVTLTCRDGNSTLTNLAILPPVVTFAPYNAGLTSEWAMDDLLRTSSPGRYYTWPELMASCTLAVSFRSSIWAQVGTLAFFVQQPTFQVGVNGTCLAHTGIQTVYNLATPHLTTDTNNARFVSADTTANVIINDSPATYELLFARFGTTLFLYTITPTGQATGNNWACPAGAHELEYSVTWAAGSATVSGTVWIDGVSHAVSFTALDTRPAGRSFTLASANGPIEGLQLTNAASYTTQYPFVPTAVLDPSLSSLAALPDVSGKSVPEVLQDMANAEAGVFLFDELNVPRFYNRNTIAAKASVKTVTSQQSLLNLDTQHQMSMCATHIKATAKQLAIQPFNTVWQLGTPISVNSGATLTMTVECDSPIVNLGTSCVILPGGGVLVAGTSAYRAAYGVDGFGPVTNLTMTVTQVDSTHVKITVYNPNGALVWLVSPQGTTYPDSSDGQAILRVGAQPITDNGAGADGDTTTSASGVVADAQWPPASVGGAITNPDFGEIVFNFPDSDWRQDVATAQSLCDDTLSDMHFPRVLYRNVTIRPDPQLQLLDVVTAVDTDVSQTNTDVLILGSYPRYSAGEWSQDLDILGTAPPGAWLLGVAGHSEFATTTYLY